MENETSKFSYTLTVNRKATDIINNIVDAISFVSLDVHMPQWNTFHFLRHYSPDLHRLNISRSLVCSFVLWLLSMREFYCKQQFRKPKTIFLFVCLPLTVQQIYSNASSVYERHMKCSLQTHI